MIILKQTSQLLCSFSVPARFLQSSLPVTKHFFSTVPDKFICSELQSVRSLIKLDGDDCMQFLQGLVTNDVYDLDNNYCIYGMILNNKGRIAHDILLYKSTKHTATDNAVLLECDSRSVDSLIRLLKMYKLRKKVDIEKLQGINIFQLMGNTEYNEAMHTINLEQLYSLCSAAHGQNTSIFKDPRLSLLGFRCLSSSAKPFSTTSVDFVSIRDYHKRRFEFGIPEGIEDLKPGKCLPLESNIDFMNGVSFSKGCYIGQELTARTYHTGVIRKRLVSCFHNSIEFQEDEKLYIISNNKRKRVGKLLSIFENKCLAIIQIQYMSDNLFTESGSTVSLTKPNWWPCGGDNPHTFS